MLHWQLLENRYYERAAVSSTCASRELGSSAPSPRNNTFYIRLQLFWFSKGFKPIKLFLFSFCLRGVANGKQMKTKQLNPFLVLNCRGQDLEVDRVCSSRRPTTNLPRVGCHDGLARSGEWRWAACRTSVMASRHQEGARIRTCLWPSMPSQEHQRLLIDKM
jgi:hypothetical protein